MIDRYRNNNREVNRQPRRFIYRRPLFGTTYELFIQGGFQIDRLTRYA